MYNSVITADTSFTPLSSPFMFLDVLLMLSSKVHSKPNKDASIHTAIFEKCS